MLVLDPLAELPDLVSAEGPTEPIPKLGDEPKAGAEEPKAGTEEPKAGTEEPKRVPLEDACVFVRDPLVMLKKDPLVVVAKDVIAKGDPLLVFPVSAIEEVGAVEEADPKLTTGGGTEVEKIAAVVALVGMSVVAADMVVEALAGVEKEANEEIVVGGKAGVMLGALKFLVAVPNKKLPLVGTAGNEDSDLPIMFVDF
ncbi:hypothetical protein L1987_15899 [Smallanthus sonchifolius]|uniref:Uncharacterized protein n=1 Tax=Smallanthus sonchifolius TaxID=185202 RepID=A0ACB9J8E1_9ASTR|nr:hypothetical protein L1987_15899 [Smallanthus sonchifolius]